MLGRHSVELWVQAWSKIMKVKREVLSVITFYFTSPQASRKIPSIPELLGAAKRDLASTLSERPGLTSHYVGFDKGLALGAEWFLL